MYIEGGHLKLKSRSKLDLPYHPIDYFFMSLAQACQHNAIGIVLSGTATDGTLGLQVIKEKGGIAGCATGEEAYSMAICLTEFLQKKKLSHPVNIFATDLNGKAVEKARPGIYSKSLVQHISAQRLNKFFIKIDGHYRIIKSIREMCIFSQHDLLKDPPFSSMDLISCQNVLIYLEPVPQKMIMQTFHYALKPSGFLLVGKSESIGSAIDLFQPTEKDSRLFTKKAVKPQRLKFGIRTKPVSPAAVFEEIRHRSENDIEKESDKILLTRYAPASVMHTNLCRRGVIRKL